MLTRQIFAPAKSAAYHYLELAIEKDSQIDYEKLRKLFDLEIFEARNFDDTPLSLETFDWQSIHRDRNWWWQLQALPFLSWFMTSLSIQSQEETERYFQLCLQAIENWAERAITNDNSPLAWHDHAAAYRARNIINWYLTCESKGWIRNGDEQAVSLARLITKHLRWLGSEKNYSKRTNHGFDQAMIGLTICSMFETEELDLYRQVFHHRLKDELTFAFTDEGVHKENSPGYQKMMLLRLEQLRHLSCFGDEELITLSDRYLSKAKSFLAAITLPNGNLPLLGDTQDGEAGLAYSQTDSLDILDYSASGYIIVRGTALDKDFHLIFKSSHLSNYHRHDDDLSLHLYYDGKVILGDGGLGSYNEKDENRISIRSQMAHNVPHFSGITPIRNIAKLNGELPHLTLNHNKLIGTTFCYGTAITRTVDLSNLHKGKITIIDEAQHKKDSTLACNIFSTIGFRESEKTLTAPLDAQSTVTLRFPGDISLEPYQAYFSKQFGDFQQITAFKISSSKNIDDNIETLSYSIDLSGTSPSSIDNLTSTKNEPIDINHNSN